MAIATEPEVVAEEPTIEAAGKKKPEPTERIVFAQDGPEDTWVIIGRGIGTSDEVRDKVVSELAPDEWSGGTFVAIPTRSWNPKTLGGIETTVKPRWS
jgi:hypothetical protein